MLFILAVFVLTYSSLCCFEQSATESVAISHALEMSAKDKHHDKEQADASNKHRNEIKIMEKQHEKE